jgi:hypothetical protein
MRLLKYAWVAPTTAVGLIVSIPLCGHWRVVDGVIEAWGPLYSWWFRKTHFNGTTFGHIILAPNRDNLDRIRLHEHVHVKQAEQWGPFYIPAYLINGLIAVIKGGNFYWDNHFEVEAYKIAH